MPPERRSHYGAPTWARLTSLALSLSGLAVTIYLSIEHYSAGATLACPKTGTVDCQKVTSSPQSAILGVPVALLGLVFFAVMVVLTLPPAWRSNQPALRVGRLASATVGVIWVIYLVYVELFIVDAICLWCTAVHALTVTLFGVLAYAIAADAPGDRATRRVRVR